MRAVRGQSMAPTNRERVGAALDLLKEGLAPYVEREMKAVYGSQWLSEAQYAISREISSINGNEPHLDCTALLAIMWNRWNEVFRQKLGHSRPQHRQRAAGYAQ